MGGGFAIVKPRSSYWKQNEQLDREMVATGEPLGVVTSYGVAISG